MSVSGNEIAMAVAARATRRRAAILVDTRVTVATHRVTVTVTVTATAHPYNLAARHVTPDLSSNAHRAANDSSLSSARSVLFF